MREGKLAVGLRADQIICAAERNAHAAVRRPDAEHFLPTDERHIRQSIARIASQRGMRCPGRDARTDDDDPSARVNDC